MNAVSYEAPGFVGWRPRGDADTGQPECDLRSTQRLAWATGLLYLVLAAFGMFAPLVLDSLVVSGDAAATADNVLGSRWLFAGSLVAWVGIVLADVVVSITFYVLLRPISRVSSLLAAALRLVYSAVLAVILLSLFEAYLLLTDADWGAGAGEERTSALALTAFDTFSAGFQLALVLFGVHLIVLGLLLHRSRYVPRVLALVLVAAGVGYAVDSLAGLLVTDYGGPASVVLLAPAVLGELGLTVWLLVKGVTVNRQVAR